ncbi:hypothetical protein ABIC44_001142 [Sphingomonas sp. 1185]
MSALDPKLILGPDQGGQKVTGIAVRVKQWVVAQTLESYVENERYSYTLSDG